MTDPTTRFITKANMDTIAAAMKEAYTNQDAFAKFTVGETDIEAASATDAIEIEAGSNVTLTPGTKKITIAATYSAATPSTSGVGGTDGLLTAADKEKLNGIAAGADDNVIDTVKVAGVALTPDANKAVDIAVATGESGVGTFKVAGTQYTVYGLGTAAAAARATNGVADGETGLVTGDEVYDAIANQISTVYKPAGNIAASGLTSSLLVAANLGKVYSLTDTLAITAANADLFKDGTAGESFPEGTDVAIIEDNDNYLFNVLAGFVDLSSYQVAADLGGLTSDEVAAIIAEL